MGAATCLPRESTHGLPSCGAMGFSQPEDVSFSSLQRLRIGQQWLCQRIFLVYFKAIFFFKKYSKSPELILHNLNFVPFDQHLHLPSP